MTTTQPALAEDIILILLRGPRINTVPEGSAARALWRSGPQAIAAVWTEHEVLLRAEAARLGVAREWGFRTRFFGEMLAHPLAPLPFPYPRRPRR